MVAIKDGNIVWQSYSEALIEAGCYPSQRISHNATDAWSTFSKNPIELASPTNSPISRWSSVYNNKASQAYYNETYFGVPIMGMLLVLLTADEKEIMR